MDQLTIDAPQRSQRVYDQAITVVGRVAADVQLAAIGVRFGDQLLGQTLCISHDGRFRLLARFVPPVTTEIPATLTVRAEDSSGVRAAVDVPVIVAPARLDQRAYGEVVPPDRRELLHRENIYGFGPPVEFASEEAVALVLQYLPTPTSVLDIGCGAGAYGPALIVAGHAWLGAEVDPQCVEILKRRRLPFRHLAKHETRLPFADAEFDAAIAIEVIEHVENARALVAEAARVTRSRFLVSVPNMEVIPYFAPLGIVPWHLLESTHVNFFTRASLHALLAQHFARVEVFSYGEHPVRTAEGIPLHLHLFAVASK